MYLVDSWQEAVKPYIDDPEFHVYEAALIGKYPNYTTCKYTGAKFHKYVRGDKKGQYNYNKMITGTKESVYVPIIKGE